MQKNSSINEETDTTNVEILNPPYVTPSFVNQDSDSESDERDLNNELEFSKNPCMPQMFENFSFNEDFMPKVEVYISSPLAVFLTIFADMLAFIVDQSNLYARPAGVNLNLNEAELKAFIGILIVMGYHILQVSACTGLRMKILGFQEFLK